MRKNSHVKNPNLYMAHGFYLRLENRFWENDRYTLKAKAYYAKSLKRLIEEYFKGSKTNLIVDKQGRT